MRKPRQEPPGLILFRTAEAYWHSSGILNKYKRKRFSVPAFVLQSFSLELYFKCLIEIEGQKLPRRHELDFLFNSLRRDHQDAIKKEYDQVITLPDYQIIRNYLRLQNLEDRFRDFDQALKASANAFVRFRYLYEDPHGANWYASPIAQAARQSLLALYPRLKSARQRATMKKLHS